MRTCYHLIGSPMQCHCRATGTAPPRRARPCSAHLSSAPRRTSLGSHRTSISRSMAPPRSATTLSSPASARCMHAAWSQYALSFDVCILSKRLPLPHPSTDALSLTHPACDAGWQRRRLGRRTFAGNRRGARGILKNAIACEQQREASERSVCLTLDMWSCSLGC